MEAKLIREPGYIAHGFRTLIPGTRIYSWTKIHDARAHMVAAGFKLKSGDVLKGMLGAGGFSSDNAKAEEIWEKDGEEPMRCFYWPAKGAECDGRVTCLSKDGNSSDEVGCCEVHWSLRASAALVVGQALPVVQVKPHDPHARSNEFAAALNLDEMKKAYEMAQLDLRLARETYETWERAEKEAQASKHLAAEKIAQLSAAAGVAGQALDLARAGVATQTPDPKP